jgi:hypothetical protein
VSFLLRLTLTLLILLNSSSLKSQTDWQNCCRGYEEGYKKGYSYPDLYLSNTVAPAPCNCVGIIGALTYEVGYIKGYEEGRQAKARFIQNQSTPSQPQTSRPKFQTHEYISPGYPSTYSSSSNINKDGLSYKIASKIVLGFFNFFSEERFMISSQLRGYGGSAFEVKRSIGNAFKLSTGISTYGQNLLTGVMIGVDYNFHDPLPYPFASRFTHVINPTLGVACYMNNFKKPMSVCGSVGLEWWLKKKTGGIGLSTKYIYGTQKTNMIQVGLAMRWGKLN